ncbi:Rieske (2Fe-2S) protein [Burkholderia sp. Bp9012]|uniref:Rieske (2Fe-2S) protein n=1 Tax=Burkholderia sp. Bp9012 TaxID=2184562 RepID=UPI000F590606|nr:Rieske (2Fe-2S) protein [Burkholderia sp. Bp9012]RQR79131.1 Rieske (2Fe-2S) protein [Burkholderia sp. Bp9012]
MTDRVSIEAHGARFEVAATCPHRGAPMKYGTVTCTPHGRCVITCPLHFSRFDLDTGEVLNGPATLPLDVTP